MDTGIQAYFQAKIQENDLKDCGRRDGARIRCFNKLIIFFNAAFRRPILRDPVPQVPNDTPTDAVVQKCETLTQQSKNLV